ncbi:MAG: 6-bladed beta-propeller [Gemmatimonadota bacterium]
MRNPLAGTVQTGHGGRGFPCALLTLVVMSLAACGDRRPPADAASPIEARVASNADPAIFELTAGPNVVARGVHPADTLDADLVLGGAERGFGHVADVAALDDGRFAVLDRMEKQVLIFDADGGRAAVYGREGEGPGEYGDPWALVAVGAHLLVWDGDPTTTFTLLDPSGQVLATAPMPGGADVMHLPFREPHLRQEWPYQGPPEDVTRRIAAYGEGAFVFHLQPSEVLAALNDEPFPYDAPSVHLIRYDIELRPRDTLAVTTAPPLRSRERRRGQLFRFAQPLFAAGPVWAAGDGWLALGHGDSSVIRVTTDGGEPLLNLRWPARSRPVTDADRIALSRWYYKEHLSKDMPSFVERWERMSQDERERRIRAYALDGRLSFAETRPEITAAYGTGPCLWIAGFRADDFILGTALKWWA